MRELISKKLSPTSLLSQGPTSARRRLLGSSLLRRLTSTVCGLCLPLAACQSNHPQDGGGAGSPHPPGPGAAGQQISYSYALPEGHSLEEFAVIAQQQLSLAEGARTLTEDDGFATVTNLGELQLSLGKAAEIGSAISVGDVVLAQGAHVHGDVTTAGSLQRDTPSHAPPSVDGTVSEHATIAARQVESVVSVPDQRAPGKEFPSSAGAEELLTPGYFERLSLRDKGLAVLQSGEYFFDSLRAHEGSSLVFDDSAGPITLYVLEHLDLKGELEFDSEDIARVTLVYLGTDSVQLDEPFEGTLIAPSAHLLLQAPESELGPPWPSLPGAHGRHGRGKHSHWHKSGRHYAAKFRAPSWQRLHDRVEDRPGGHGQGHPDHGDDHPGHGHGHDHDHEAPEVESIPYVGTFIARDVSLGKRVTLIHHPLTTDTDPEAGGTSFTFEFPLPGGVSPEEVDIASITGTEIGSGVTFEPGCNPTVALVTASSDGTTRVGGQSKLGNIVSEGSIRLSGSTEISGAVSSASGVNLAGANVSGQVQENATLSTRTLSWNMVFPADPQPDLELQAGRARVLYPEVYGSVSLADGAILYLRSGTYHFNSLVVAPGAQLVLESSGGPLTVYVKDELRLEGNVSGLGGVTPELFVGYAGRRAAFVGGAFDGTLLAPRAHVSVLGGSHRGQILARSVDVGDGVTLRQCSAPWGFILGEGLTNPVPMDLPSSPVLLMAEAGHDASAAPSSPVRFPIPSTLPLSGGNAGNGTAVLRFTTPGGTTVSCTYRGGSSMEHPDTLLEVAKGREYLFQSCSNGAAAGSTATGTSFDLSVQGDSQGVGTVGVNLGLGEEGCDGMMRAPISPARSIEMLQAFDWSTAPELPEHNADGTPTLFYANIYIRNAAERELLDRFLIHYSGKPFFDDELEALYGGQCGSLDLSGDGNGIFVFSILPGATYNRIRAAVFKDDIRPEERVLFQAIVLREAPAALTNADGSLDYEGLKTAGYYYLDLRALPVDAALDQTALPAGGAQAFINAIEFVAIVATEVVRGVVDVLGEIDRLAQGEVTVGVALHMRSRDSAFADPIARGWGRDAGDELRPRSVRIEIHQWAQRWYTLGIPLPTSFHGYANERGEVRLRVARGSDGFDGATSVRGESGLCVELENNAAKITHFLLSQEVCNFKPLNVTSIVDGSWTRNGRSAFGNFERNVDVEVRAGSFEMSVLNEATNTFDYTRQVMGMALPQAKILTGANATALSFSDSQLWAPCLSFPNLVTDLTIYGTMGIPIVGPFVSFYLGVLGTSDIVVPTSSSARGNYGKITHEYGHYVLCGLLNRYDETPYVTMTTLITDTIGAGSLPDPGEDARLINEAFADFIAGQVMGGADYIRLGDARSTEMQVCNNTGNQCWDENLWSENDGDEVIGRIGTLLHDGFDGHRKGSLNPTNGDAWATTGFASPLVYTPTSYGNAYDELVKLGGPDVIKVFDRFFFQNNLEAVFSGQPPVGSYRISALEAALGGVVVDKYNWCKACNMFEPHNQDTSGFSQLQLWEACRDDARVVHAIGSPPDADVRLNRVDCSVCPDGQVSTAEGKCVACAANEFVSGNTCVACGLGSIPTADGGCVSCAANEISVGSGCVPCPLGQGPDRTLNVCADCAIDAIADWSTVPYAACGSMSLSQVSAPGDICPEEFWVEAVNLNGVSPDGRSSDISFNLDLQNDIDDAAQCRATEMHGVLAEVQAAGLVALSSTDSTVGLACVPSTVPLLFCDARCDHPADLSLTSAEVAAGRTSVRVMARALGPEGGLPSEIYIGTSGGCVVGPPL